jgi:hypothetical protein
MTTAREIVETMMRTQLRTLTTAEIAQLVTVWAADVHHAGQIDETVLDDLALAVAVLNERRRA